MNENVKVLKKYIFKKFYKEKNYLNMLSCFLVSAFPRKSAAMMIPCGSIRRFAGMVQSVVPTPFSWFRRLFVGKP